MRAGISAAAISTSGISEGGSEDGPHVGLAISETTGPLLQILVCYIGLLREMTEQADLEWTIPVERNREAHDRTKLTLVPAFAGV